MTKEKLSDFGEKNLISEIIKKKYFKNLTLDDCAVINFGDNSLLISVDQLFSKPFLLNIGGTYEEIGKLFVTQNISDIAAMGGEPIGFFSSLSMPADFEINNFELLLKGIKEELDFYNVELLGGDTKQSEKIVLSGTVLGSIGRDKVLKRKGAEIGEIICVSGMIGKSFSNYIDYSANESENLYCPKARIDFGKLLSASGLCTSCIDLSDGLFSALNTLSEANNLTYNIDTDKIPLTFPINFQNNIDWINYILNIGGDFELLFTLKNTSESKDFIETNSIYKIGYTSKLEKNVLLTGNRSTDIIIKPWEHFSNLESFNLNFKNFIHGNNVHNL